MCEKTMGRRGLLTCVSLMLLVAVLTLPKAARAVSIEAKGRAAKVACLSGDYAKGVGLLAEMFVSTGDAIHIYNQGRCFEQNGKYEEAIVRFREFLRKHPESDAAGGDAEKHIADCEALIDKQKGKATPTPTPPVETKPVVEPVPAPVPVPAPAPVLAPVPLVQVAAPPPAPVVPPLVEAPAAVAPAEPVTEGKPFYKTWWFWTAAGTAIVAGTVTAFLLTRSAPDACDGAGTRCVGVK
jgi:hypothetical protein